MTFLCSWSPQIAKAETPDEPSSIHAYKQATADVSLPNKISYLYIPNLTWDAIIEAYQEQDLGFLDSSAFANLSAPHIADINEILNDRYFDVLSCDANTTVGDNLRLAYKYYTDNLNSSSTLVIVGTPAFVGGQPSGSFSPVIIVGHDFAGVLHSELTHQNGLVTCKDLITLGNDIFHGTSSNPAGIKSSASTSEVLAKAAANGSSAASLDTVKRADELAHKKAVTDSVVESKQMVSLIFLTMVLLSFAMSLLLLILGRQDRPGSRKILIRTVRILWLLVLSYPVATFLMFIILPARPNTLDLYIALVAWIIAIALLALVIGRGTKWVNSLITLFGLTILVILVGQVFGGPLASPGYMTYDVTLGYRYYGMGNEQGAMLFGSWITLSGLLINRYPKLLIIKPFKRWGFLLGSALLLFVATSPWFGASFGPLVWGFLGCVIAWCLFNKIRLRWWMVLIVVLGAVALALGVLYLDISNNPASHMAHVSSSTHDGLPALFSQLIGDVWTYSLKLIQDFVPLVAVIFFAVISLLLVVLRVFQPGTYREFWQRNQAFRAAYSVCFVLAAITFVLEDSGIFTPAVLIIYPVACFVWLVCDLHSWHLRVLAEQDSPLTIGELQRLSLGIIIPRSSGAHFKGGKARFNPVGTNAGSGRATVTHTSNVSTVDLGKRALGGAHFANRDKPVDVDDAELPGSSSVGRSTATMSIATLLSRVTGFGRTLAMAFALGNTAFTTSYSIANNVPNMIYELVAGGVLATAFLPIYLAQLEKHGKSGAAKYTSNILGIAAIVLGTVVVLATVFAPQVIYTQTFLAEAFDAQSATFFFRFFAVQIIFYGVGAIISGLLNAHRSFLWPALGPVFNNLVTIVTLLAFPFVAQIDLHIAMVWLGIGTSLGVVAMFVVQLPALIKLKIPLRFRLDLKDPALKDTLKLAGPAFVFVVMGIITVMAMNNFATATTNNGPSTIMYAWMWYQLPYGVIAVALSTALLTEMSAASAAGNWDVFRANVRMGLRTTMFLIIPLAAIIFTLSTEFAGLFYFGAFTADDVVNVAAIVSMWCIALPFYAAYNFIYRVFSAMRDLGRFVFIDSIGRVIQVALYGLFTLGISGFAGFDKLGGLGLIGIPLTDACINILLCAVMLFQLRKKIGSFGLSKTVIGGLRVLAAALISVAGPFVVLLNVSVTSPLISLAFIVGLGMLSLVIFYILGRLFGIPEVLTFSKIGARLGARLIGRSKK